MRSRTTEQLTERKSSFFEILAEDGILQSILCTVNENLNFSASRTENKTNEHLQKIYLMFGIAEQCQYVGSFVFH